MPSDSAYANRLRRYFERAGEWDAAYERQDARAHWWATRLEKCLELAGGGPGDALEIGPGPGRLLEELDRRGWTVSAVDLSPEMVELARRRVPAARDRIVVGEAETLPLADRSFDLVVVLGVLEYAARAPALAEVARVLRPGGTAVVGFQNGRSPVLVWRRAVVLPAARQLKRLRPFGRPIPPERGRPVSPAEARRALTDAGLDVISETCVACGVLPDPLDRIVPRLGYAAARAAERSPRLRALLGTQRLFLVRPVETAG